MNHFVILARDVHDQLIPLQHPLSLQLTRSVDSPADSLQLLVAAQQPIGQLATLTIQLDGQLLFSGFIDTQMVSRTAQGFCMRISARSRGALLLDNEAIPRQYAQIRLSELFDIVAKPYGFTTWYGPGNPIMPLVNIRKGMSEWEALCTFCKLRLGITPFIDLHERIIISQLPPLGVHRLSNTDRSQLPFSQIQLAYNRCEVISRIFLRDENDQYTSSVQNPQANDLGIIRRRMVIPSGEFAARPIADAQSLIRQSMLRHQVVTVVLNRLHQCELGDLVEIDDPAFALQEQRIGEIVYLIDENGATTRLKLYENTYW